MKLIALVASGYRNLNGRISLPDPLAILVGENNAGKSNVVDALRTILDPEAGPRARCWLGVDDFAHDGHGNRATDELELEIQLAELTEEEQARMVTCLAPSLEAKHGKGCARLRMRAQLGADDRVNVQWYGGDSEHPDIDRHAREAIRFVYLHPLRDAAADLRPGRDNRLVDLIKALAPEGHPDQSKIVDTATKANQALGEVDAIRAAKHHVARRLSDMTGRGRFSQRSDLVFADPRFERVVGSLRAMVGQFEALEMAENGLGYNNLLYMAVLLAALADAPDDGSIRVLLVEEPEAHLHPQLQDLLMRFLEVEAGGGTQVVVTTHSPNFASSARVERLSVLTRPAPRQGLAARAPAEFGLESKQLDYLRRFLDVTKAALFFARGVILVEGVAEQLLLPVIARRLGRSLAANGVTVINVGGLAFPPFTELFASERLPYRLAVVSDSDGDPGADELEGSDEGLSPRARQLAEREDANVRVRLAPRTFEWALVEAGNIGVMLQALEEIKPKVARRLRSELEDASAAAAGDAILAAVNDVKGRYAQALADLLEDFEQEFHVPGYLSEAIEWVAERVEAAADESGAEDGEGERATPAVGPDEDQP